LYSAFLLIEKTGPAVTQAHYLNIAVDGDGLENNDLHSYTYSQMMEIWRAANATKSDIMVFWYSPEALLGEFKGTDYEFVRITMPSTSQECLDYRLDEYDRCSSNPELRVGDARGVCHEPPNALSALMSASLHNKIYDPSIPEAARSPAYDVLKSFRITEFQLAEMFIRMREGSGDPREAVCDWAADHIDYLQSFVPRGYPREFVEREANVPFMYASTIVGGVVFACVLLAAGYLLVGSQKLSRNLRLELLATSLLGLLLVAAGAATMGGPQSNGTCIAQVWLINIGYTLLFVPLIVKVHAINTVSRAAVHFRRKEVSHTALLKACALVNSVVVVYLILWTILETPRTEPEFPMIDDNEEEPLVAVSEVCSAESMAWNYVSVGWVAILIFVTSILAFQMSKIGLEEYDETPALALMVYSHFFFTLCRLITYFMQGGASEYTLFRIRSLIISMDALAVLVIYYLPRICTSLRPEPELKRGRSTVLVLDNESENTTMLRRQVQNLKDEIESLKNGRQAAEERAPEVQNHSWAAPSGDTVDLF
jgi:hypothetical protein